MYLFIFEDGYFAQQSNVTTEDLQSVKDGNLDIVNMLTKKHYGRDGRWHELDELEQ